MSSRTQDATTKAASMIDDRVHWGADAVSNAAHQAADQVNKATDYVWKKSEKLREQASSVSQVASDHPVYTLAAVGLIGFGLGFLLRGRGRS